MVMEKPDDLRKLAEWYRGMAEVGHSEDCSWRKRLAEYLEKRAHELEDRCHQAQPG
jgi:hypothetical protein